MCFIEELHWKRFLKLNGDKFDSYESSGIFDSCQVKKISLFQWFTIKSTVTNTIQITAQTMTNKNHPKCLKGLAYFCA